MRVNELELARFRRKRSCGKRAGKKVKERWKSSFSEAVYKTDRPEN